VTYAERTGRLSSSGLAIVLPGGLEAAVEARSAVGLLRRPIGPELLPLIELLVTELVSNSVRHGGAGPNDSVRLALAVSEEAVRVEVSDLGPGFRPAPHPLPATDGRGGWGLIILDRSATRWGTRRGGRCVWFELDRNGGYPSAGPRGSRGDSTGNGTKPLAKEA
jgi:anti-sigma regulatory factor (Ser/Thr protein kinase)